MTDSAESKPGLFAAAPWLVLATGLLLISNGRWIVPVATWVAPAALLVFLDRSKTIHALGVALVVYVLVQFVMWWGLIPAPGLLYFLIAGTYGVVYFLPFIAYRVLSPKLGGIATTLVFPLAWVAIEFVFHRWGTPYGSWFSLAYTQVGTITLLQLASVTGMAGISFLLTWFAAIVAYAIRTGFTNAPNWSAVKRVALTYTIVLLAVLAAGHLRLQGERDRAALTRTAGLVPNPMLMRELETALVPVRLGESISEASLDSIATVANRLNDDLFRRSRREAVAGAQLVAWSETAGRVLLADEPVFLERAAKLATEQRVHLILAYGVWIPDAAKPFDNKVVAVSEHGAIQWHYRKAHPIVGAESPFTETGDGVIRSVQTGDRSFGAVICHDLDFPRLLRQAHDSGIGLVIGPSADWQDITPLHANMAIVRSVEGGFSLLRPTSGGRSIAVDTRGRTIASVDYATDAFVAHLSMQPSRTIYGVVGDLFSWICVVGFVLVMITAFSKRRRHA